jgi:hypothetical protein
MDDKSNFEKAFDRNMSGEKRNLRVWLINPPLENPWRTQGDYRLEQKRLNTNLSKSFPTH